MGPAINLETSFQLKCRLINLLIAPFCSLDLPLVEQSRISLPSSLEVLFFYHSLLRSSSTSASLSALPDGVPSAHPSTNFSFQGEHGRAAVGISLCETSQSRHVERLSSSHTEAINQAAIDDQVVAGRYLVSSPTASATKIQLFVVLRLRSAPPV